MKYYYDPVTGIFRYRVENDTVKYDLPYIEKIEPGWRYSDYRVDLETSTLIYEPQLKNPRA